MNNTPSTGDRPTWGEEAAQLCHTGRPERGRLTAKTGMVKGGSDGFLGTKSNRSMSYERMGASLAPRARLYEANAAEATDTPKRVLQMPSRASWTDSFRAKAKYGRSM